MLPCIIRYLEYGMLDPLATPCALVRNNKDEEKISGDINFNNEGQNAVRNSSKLNEIKLITKLDMVNPYKIMCELDRTDEPIALPIHTSIKKIK